MSADLVNEFLLSVDDLPTSVHQTFELATQAALVHKKPGVKLNIQTTSSPIVRTPSGQVGVAPIREWNFASDIEQWVESHR